MANQTGLHLFSSLTLDCQCLLHFHLVLLLNARLVVLNFVTHVYLPGLTLNCQLKQSSIHLVNSINWISLIFFKSIFLIFIFSISLQLHMLSPTLLSTFHLFIVFLFVWSCLLSFFFVFSLLSFIFPHFNKCEMQMSCP